MHVHVRPSVCVCAHRLCAQRVRKPENGCERGTRPDWDMDLRLDQSLVLCACPGARRRVLFPGRVHKDPNRLESPHPDIGVGAQVCPCVSSTVTSSCWDRKQQAPSPRAGPHFGVLGTRLRGAPLEGNMPLKTVG